jgi:UDP-N-acetylmuramoyl-L-alanyl-D-glutamate--2,6-diaminopimelate ligase
MRLSELLGDLAPLHGADPVISGLSMDSRLIKPGDLFIALPGGREHGWQHAEEAIAKGARALLCVQQGLEAPVDVGAVAAPCAILPRLGMVELSELADRFYRHPARGMRLLGVTGTNGKTSVSWLAAQAGLLAGHESGVIGTLGVGPWPRLAPGSHTTPDLLDLRRALSQLRDQGVRRVCMEVSSHALDQQRVAGLSFDVALLTNISRDHLDYHGTMAAYCQAKARLFEQERCQRAVLPAGDALGRELAQTLRARGTPLITTAIDGDADLVASELRLTAEGAAFQLSYGGESHAVSSALMGRFNVENLLLVAAALLHEGLSLSAAAGLLGRLEAPPGRLQPVLADRSAPRVVVDYAHTPDALAQALSTLRPLCDGRLIAVFGCGGERDAGKRSAMGEAASRIADALVLTEDNSRSESVESICQDIMQGLAAGPACQVITDRHEAIVTAIANAGPKDIVLLAGKGHEATLDRGDEVLDFDDVVHARQALQRRSSA